MSHEPLIARATDVGYGHVKWADGRDDKQQIRCDSFASQSPIARDVALSGGVIHSRDTFLIDIEGRRYEVGRAVALAGQSNQEGEVLDNEFALSAAYRARLYGALSYMLPSLKSRVIDYLVLGLPLTTWEKYSAQVASLYSGEHTVNHTGVKVTVRECMVYPQPLGAYMAFMHEHVKKTNHRNPPMALVVDPGYNTVDWFACKGMSANEGRSGAVQRGMSYVLRAIAEKIAKSREVDASVTELVRRIDASMATNTPLTLYGKEFDLSSFKAAGADIIDEAAQAVKNSVGSGADIDVIVVAGGGAPLYTDAIKNKFPHHNVVALNDPSFANVRGFQIIGELLASSASRARVA